MKRIYTTLGACLVAVLAIGQTAQERNFAAFVPAKTDITKTERVNHVSQAKATPFWTNDFSNASDWTISNDAGNNDDWVIGTGVPSGSFAIAGIMSTTVANGFALFDSDLLCSGSQDANLTTATSIDCSTRASVLLEFEQYYRNYQGQTFVEVSTNGTSWTAFQVNANVAANVATANPDVVSLNISSVAANQSTVWIRFNYVGGCDYAWMVDDVALSEASANEMVLLDASYSDFGDITYLDYSMLQIDQARELTFRGAYLNNGSAAQTNVTFTAAVSGADTYSGSTSLASVAAGASDTMTVSTTWTPSSLGAHTIDYTLSQDETDDDPTNNTISGAIEVTEFIYGRDNNSLVGGWNNDPDGFEVGNTFDIYGDQTVYAIDVVLDDRTAVGAIIYAAIYDDQLNYIEGSADYTVTAADLNAVGGNVSVSIPLNSPQAVTSGSNYTVVIGSYGGADAVYVGSSGTSLAQTSFLLDGSDNSWYYVTSTPMVRMNMNPSIGLAELDQVNGVTLMQNYPNPTNGLTTVEFEVETAQNITIEVYDLAGKKVAALPQGTVNVGTQRVTLDLSNLTSGLYNYSLNTENGRITKRLSVVR